jgi:hypothetical protein
MAGLIDFIRDSFEHLHSWWDDALADLTPDQLHYVPDHHGNHIGFIAWHVVRTEDNLVQFVFQNRTPTIWLQGGYDAKFGLHRTSQGTGCHASPATVAGLARVPEGGLASDRCLARDAVGSGPPARGADQPLRRADRRLGDPVHDPESRVYPPGRGAPPAGAARAENDPVLAPTLPFACTDPRPAARWAEPSHQRPPIDAWYVLMPSHHACWYAGREPHRSNPHRRPP